MIGAPHLEFVDVTLHRTQALSEDRSNDENSSAEGRFQDAPAISRVSLQHLERLRQ